MIDLLLRKRLLDVVVLVPVSPEDDIRIADLKRQRLPQESIILETAQRLGLHLSPAIWATVIGACLYNWDEWGSALAPDLPPGGGLDVNYDSHGDASAVSALRHAAAGLVALDDGELAPQMAGTFVAALIELSAYAENRGEQAAAYDLLHFATVFLEDENPLLSQTTEPGLRLALAGGKPAQIAIMSAKAAVAAVVSARDDPELRLLAYDACELAIERISLADEAFRLEIANMLMPSLEKREWLNHLCVRLFPFVATAEGKARYRELLGAPDWPARVNRTRSDDAENYYLAMFHLMRAEMDFENTRLELRKRIQQHEVITNSLDWSFTLMDFANAVPHSGSLMKERKLAERLAVLTHEITHVLSFLGGIGIPLLALRVAGIEIAAELWRTPEGTEAEELSRIFWERHGIAELSPGDASLLLSAERQLDVRRKAQILLDTWTPWLEGLAVYGELGAAPDLDPTGINPVTECLRNLVDFFITDPEDPQSPAEQARVHFAEFEQRCSEALRSIGPRRLDDHIRLEGELYFQGYLAVRSVAARWRSRTEQNLTSAQCFDLLLHATRYGVHSHIPDLSLRADEFTSAARQGMVAFVKSLANLTGGDVRLYLDREDPSSPGRPIAWRHGRPSAMDDAEVAKALEDQKDYVNERLTQALRSLTRPEDLDRIDSRSPQESEFLAAITAVARKALEARLSSQDLTRLNKLFKGMFELGSILPIGHCSSPFYLQIYDDLDIGRVYVNVRTTESHVDTGNPSYNGLWFPLDTESAMSLSDSYRAHARPRLDITRVIMLDTFDFGQVSVRFPHFFAFSCQDWFDIRGTSQWSQAIQDKAPEIWAGCRHLIERRLTANEIIEIEREYISSGNEAIERTLAWLTDSPRWRLGDEPLQVSRWVAHQVMLARSLLDEHGRRADRRSATEALMVALYGETSFARRLGATSFSELTRKNPGLRRGFEMALYETGRIASADPFLDQNAQKLSIDSQSLFEQSTFGWDVRQPNLGGAA